MVRMKTAMLISSGKIVDHILASASGGCCGCCVCVLGR
jgi:hypothetical protein